MANYQPIIFTDLDGTLLSHEDYRYDAVAEFLPEISDIPIVLATSKTQSEVAVWRDRLGLKSPYMVENGSAIFYPKKMSVNELVIDDRHFIAKEHEGWLCFELGVPIEQLLDFLEPYRADIINFVTCDLDQAIALTGLNASEVTDARNRAYSVPMVVEDELASTIACAAEASGLKTVRGGRFMHLQGACDKGLALRLVRALMEKQHQIKHHAIAMGDSDNDIEMLLAADTAVVVSNPHGSLRKLEREVIRTELPAPEGWVQGIKMALEQER